MKITNNPNGNSFSDNGFVKLKNKDWLDKQRVAGKITAGALSLLEKEVKNKTSLSLIQLNQLAEEYILDNHCIPTFKNYKGFPAGVCISVNYQLVHGIPSNYKLEEGDVVKFDLGATYKGAIADSAITCIYGTPKNKKHVDLINATKKALYAGIESISVGKRLGVIGNAIYKSVKRNGFNVITKYGGHGLDEGKPHAQPFVHNKSNPDDGIRIKEGLTIAIEPMLVFYNTDTRTLSDGWTVVTSDIGTHAEHTIFVHENYVEIITRREGELE